VGKLQNNKLRQVAEAIGVSDAAYIDDIDNQTDPDNYAYDEIGNLIKDTKEGITKIEWTVYGKISKIEKTNGINITYTYDASGNRISKQIGVAKTTYYVRDASGNVMSVYDAALKAPVPEGTANSCEPLDVPCLSVATTIAQSEIHLYGSSRLGIYNVNKNVLDLQIAVHNETTATFVRGEKFYELSNHLGNVLVTVSDKRIAVDTDNDGIINYYNADVVTANDYYPFGMQMPGRKYNSGNGYRYGFNGQENSDEIAAGLTTAMYWEYDSRIGRRWNVDPVYKHSPYSCFADNPNWFSDPNGLDTVPNRKNANEGDVFKHKSGEYLTKGANGWFDKSGVAYSFLAPNHVIKVSSVQESFRNPIEKIVSDRIKFTLYVQQPVKNSRWFKMAPYNDGILDVGHTFISIEMNVSCSNVKQTFGFYPLKKSGDEATPINPSASGGKFRDNRSHLFTHSISININEQQYLAIMSLSYLYENTNYSLDKRNCTDFGLDAANLAGLVIYDTKGSWFPFQQGNNPASLGQSIKEGKYQTADWQTLARDVFDVPSKR
jgi:YD repeat-containing protein